MLKARSLSAVAGLFLCLSLLSCRQSSPAGNEPAETNQAIPSVNLPAFPLPQPPLDRAHLLTAIAQAASDYAAGIDDSQRQKDLADQKFEFRIRFGCNGPDGPKAKSVSGWSLDPDTHALRVHAAPTLSKGDPAVVAIADSNFEAVEGFWIDRPWLMAAVCPRPLEAPAADAGSPGDSKAAALAPAETSMPPVQPAHIAGIAQFFTAADPRTMRRDGRSYEATKRLDDNDQVKGGFDLVLSGRLVALPDGRVIACTPAGADQRPACIASVEFGKVSLERADTHETLAEWGSG